MIEAIIFDWGGVLIENPNEKMDAYCADSLGVDIVLFRDIFSKFEADFHKGNISEDILWDKICSELKISKPSKQSLWTDAFKSAYQPKEEIFFLASSLRNNGYKICILSNTELPSVEFFNKQHPDMFDTIIFSCVEGYIKPENKIYEIALEKLRVDASEVVFIDDSPNNIQGAKEVGIHTILFENESQLKNELSRFSINFH